MRRHRSGWEVETRRWSGRWWRYWVRRLSEWRHRRRTHGRSGELSALRSISLRFAASWRSSTSPVGTFLHVRSKVTSTAFELAMPVRRRKLYVDTLFTPAFEAVGNVPRRAVALSVWIRSAEPTLRPSGRRRSCVLRRWRATMLVSGLEGF
jgi:hypothetical protein